MKAMTAQSAVKNAESTNSFHCFDLRYRTRIEGSKYTSLNQQVQNEALRICLKLPKYIRIKLLHEYGSMLPLEERLKFFNLKLLRSMKLHNPHVHDLIVNHSIDESTNLQSPLDIILNQLRNEAPN